jgi:hypothetical protein
MSQKIDSFGNTRCYLLMVMDGLTDLLQGQSNSCCPTAVYELCL